MAAARYVSLVLGMAVGVGVMAWEGSAAAGPPAPPKVSSFAPAEDLAAQVAVYVKKLNEAVESEEEYNDSKDRIDKDANTLIVIALALGMHDEANEYKAVAPGLIKAAGQLAAAKDYESAKAGAAAVEAAAKGGPADSTPLEWDKVASLPALMKQVPLLSTRLKQCVKGSRLRTMAKESRGKSAVLAAIGQVSMANSGQTKKPEESEQWYRFCVEMRDAAAAVNAGVRAGNADAVDKGMKSLTKGCDDCHAVFLPEELREKVQALDETSE